MAIDRACVFKAQVFKHVLGLNEALRLLLNHLCQGIQRGRIFQHLLANFFGIGIKPAAHQFMQVMVQGSHGGADGHVVVIQDHQQVAVGGACIVQGLIGHARCESAIANDGHSFALTAHLLGRHGHAKSGRNTG